MEDSNLIDRIKNEVGYEGKLFTYKQDNPNNQDQYRLAVYSKQMVDDLLFGKFQTIFPL